MILIASYNPLNEEFFCRTRSVPMFVGGMIETAYISADRIRMTPATFFEHDCFHVLDFTNQKDRAQQYKAFANASTRWHCACRPPSCFASGRRASTC